MTDEELQRTPIASAPLSVLLLACDPQADVASAVAVWVDVLRELKRNFEIIVVGKTRPGPASETSPEAPVADSAVSTDLPEKKAEVHPLTERFPEVRVVPWESDLLGTLLRTGLAEATQPLVLYTLADRQYQPADLNKLLESIDQVDIVTGIRTGTPIPLWLKVLDFCLGWFCAVLFGLPLEPRTAWLGWRGLSHRLLALWCFGVAVHDPECTFCLVRREMLRRIVIQSAGSFAPVEFLAKANFLNALLAEVPVSFTPGPNHHPAEKPSFFEDAITVFRRPDFGPVSVSQPEAQATSHLPM
jgi:hypothetical protein